MSSPPPSSAPKSWAQIASQAPAETTTTTAPKTATASSTTPKASTTTPPPARVEPKPAKALPPTRSTAATQPCFASLSERGYPLGFDSLESFTECMEALCQTAHDAGIACAYVGVRGSAATYASSNPNKRGQHFDSRGKGKSDIDAFIVSDDYLKCRPSREGFCHPDKVAASYPTLGAWGAEWGKALGREITPGIHRSDAPAMSEPAIFHACDC